MHWTRLHYKNELSLVVSDDLLLAIREHTGRPVLEGDTLIHRICLEQGGPCYTDRPYEEVLFCDLAIRIPSEDLQPLLLQWGNAPQVISRGQTFYCFSSWPWQCLAVTAEQRADLLALFHSRVNQAARRTTAFRSTRRSPEEVLLIHYQDYDPDKIPKFRA